jgi:4'-phosphopantetheinyl transferase
MSEAIGKRNLRMESQTRAPDRASVRRSTPQTAALRFTEGSFSKQTFDNSTQRLELLWPPPPVQWTLDEGAIHIWALPLDFAPNELADCSRVLNAEEKERAARFHFQVHRNRFVAGRGSLRLILSRYLQIEPVEIEFCYSPQGKPFLARASDAAPLHFNLAHSDELALLAFARSGSVGVDVERIRPLRDAAQLVERFFSRRESELFQKLPDDQKPAAFFNLWTRKEALLKGTGEGIAHSLNRIEVSFLPGESAAVLPGSAMPQIAEWTLNDLRPAVGFAAALAARFAPARINSWRWSEPVLFH